MHYLEVTTALEISPVAVVAAKALAAAGSSSAATTIQNKYPTIVLTMN